jgi:endonuclease YncB( thermonuclease family)
MSLVIALLLSVYTLGSAAVLQGQVTAVVDGQTIAVVTVKHQLKVRLLGMAPPAAHQPYADIARQHLADLLLNKFVEVRYSRLDGNYLIGQVVCGTMDAGAQMLRDGVAWYDQADEHNLSDRDVHLYVENELAARGEHRGLWQDGSAVSPWDFLKAETVRRNTSTVALPRAEMFGPRGNPAGLSSDDLFGGTVGAGSLAGRPSVRKINLAAVAGHWSRYQPEGEHFSVLLPSDATEITYPILDGEGKAITVRYVMGTMDGTLYVLMSANGSNDNATDAGVAAGTIKGFLAGINRSLETGKQGFALTSKTGKELNVSGFVGRQYDLSGGDLSGLVRVLSKQTGDQREVFMLSVLNSVGAENRGDRFLSSFKLGPNKTQ